jgi:hypothetical protein
LIQRYDSIAALRAAYIASGRRPAHDSPSNLSWYGNETEEQTLRFSQSGDVSLVPQAEAMLAALDTIIETPRRTWERAPAGAFCCVPDVLAGLPTPMRRATSTPDDRAPITIFVNTSCSAGISAKVIQKRGIAILALVMALSRIRPVSLQQLAILDGYRDNTGETIITSEINTSPLDLATACYVLTSVGFARRLTYKVGEAINGFKGRWPASFSYYSPQPYYDALAPRLTSDVSRCLIIGVAQLGDALLSAPIVWINAQIHRFTSREDF